jgi:hypothetical protein
MKISGLGVSLSDESVRLPGEFLGLFGGGESQGIPLTFNYLLLSQ